MIRKDERSADTTYIVRSSIIGNYLLYRLKQALVTFQKRKTNELFA